MAKAVLTTKVTPTYDDLPEKRYHFPGTYLRQMEAAVNDWIVYYEPRRVGADPSVIGGRQAYFATARRHSIVRDNSRDSHFYGIITDFLDFERPVPFSEGSSYYEAALMKEDGSTNRGAFGRAVRNLSDREYDLILQAGFSHVLGRIDRPRTAPDVPEQPQSGFYEYDQAFFEVQPRSMVQTVSLRPFRDRAFSVAIKSAYGDTCAVTGLKLINGLGRSEVDGVPRRGVAGGLGRRAVRHCRADQRATAGRLMRGSSLNWPTLSSVM